MMATNEPIDGTTASPLMPPGLAPSETDRVNVALLAAGVLQLLSLMTPAVRIRLAGTMPFYRLPNAGIALVVLGVRANRAIAVGDVSRSTAPACGASRLGVCANERCGCFQSRERGPGATSAVSDAVGVKYRP
jgi:hypothetical protein